MEKQSINGFLFMFYGLGAFFGFGYDLKIVASCACVAVEAVGLEDAAEEEVGFGCGYLRHAHLQAGCKGFAEGFEDGLHACTNPQNECCTVL